jgi:hypothetical protein
MAEDKNKKNGTELDDDENKPNETILEEQERDPDEAVFAEQAILHYASDVMDMFADQAELAMQQLEQFVMSSNHKDALDEGYFLESLGEKFLHKAMDAFGGADSPIATQVFPLLTSAVDQTVRGGNAQGFCLDLASALRDASSYVRDSLQMILSNQWDELRDLAYEGSTDFIPALHAYGLPEIDFDARALSEPLIHKAEKHLEHQPKKHEEKVEQDQVAQFEEEEKKLEEDPEMQNLALEEEEKDKAAI